MTNFDDMVLENPFIPITLHLLQLAPLTKWSRKLNLLPLLNLMLSLKVQTSLKTQDEPCNTNFDAKFIVVDETSRDPVLWVYINNSSGKRSLNPGNKENIFKPESRSEQQIFSCFNFISSNFTDLISLKEKQMECIWRITCSEEDVLVVFPTEFDKRHDSESDEIVSPHWVVVVSPLEYTRKQKVENLKNTHWRIKSVLRLTWFF